MISIPRSTLYKIVYYFVLISFVIPMIGVLAEILRLFSSENTTDTAVLRTEYILMIVQAVLGIISINIPKFLMEKYSVMNILAQITLNISFLQISAALIPRKRTAELKDRHIYPFVGTAKMPSKRNSIKKKRLHQFVYSSTEE